MIEIYTKSDCSFCVNAKDFMIKNNMSYIEYKLDKDFSREQLKEKFPTAKTYPVIVVEGNYIGGYIDLKSKFEKPKWLDSGEWNGN